MADDSSAELVPLVSHEHLNNAFWIAIRMFVGRGKRHSASQVSIGAGVHRRTLDCYRGYTIGHTDHRPLDYDQMFSIASWIGADLTSEWIRFMGQTAYNLPETEPDPSGLARENSYDNADLTSKALDGTFKNDCPKEVTAIGRRMMSRGAHLVAVGGRKAVA